MELILIRLVSFSVQHLPALLKIIGGVSKCEIQAFCSYPHVKRNVLCVCVFTQWKDFTAIISNQFVNSFSEPRADGQKVWKWILPFLYKPSLMICFPRCTYTANTGKLVMLVGQSHVKENMYSWILCTSFIYLFLVLFTCANFVKCWNFILLYYIAVAECLICV